jgi:hypothetical protein
MRLGFSRSRSRSRSLALPLPLAFALMLGAAAAPALAAEYDCEGLFNPATTLAELEAHFGTDNVVTGEVAGPEGTTVIATTIYPGDEQAAIEVHWFDEEKSEYLGTVYLAANDSGPGGVRIGMGIEEIAAINGAPFDLLGFGWDYGGAAWFEEGTLSEAPGGCSVNIRLSTSADEALSDAEMTAISGDVILRSDDPNVIKAQPVAWRVALNFPVPPEIEARWEAEYEEGGE